MKEKQGKISEVEQQKLAELRIKVVESTQCQNALGKSACNSLSTLGKIGFIRLGCNGMSCC
ncbi:hypothetical protein [Providencia stuartii]|uniref:hypothetical protein n=1 Tax=Providencia stuartii TaxID=588 RepID=UPI000AFE1878